MAKTRPFEKYSNEYDKWFEENSELYEAELEAIRQVLPPPEAQGIEVGVGSGKFAVPLGIKIGVEPSERMAYKARLYGIKVHKAVAEALPFSNNRFDFVLMVTTICFVDDVQQSFKEAFRVLKAGGCIIVGFVDKESQLGKKYSLNRANSKFYKDAVFFSSREVLKHLVDANFQISEIKQTLIPEEPPGTVENGLERGAFIVVKALK